jgi:hypothetical protein
MGRGGIMIGATARMQSLIASIASREMVTRRAGLRENRHRVGLKEGKPMRGRNRCVGGRVRWRIEGLPLRTREGAGEWVS